MRKNHLEEKIKSILFKFPETRNDDIVLTVKLWKIYYQGYILKENFISLSALSILPSQAAITRIRAKIQNDDKLYLPTDPRVFYHRMRSSKEWQKILGYEKSWKSNQWISAISDYIANKNTFSLD